MLLHKRCTDSWNYIDIRPRSDRSEREVDHDVRDEMLVSELNRLGKPAREEPPVELLAGLLPCEKKKYAPRLEVGRAREKLTRHCSLHAPGIFGQDSSFVCFLQTNMAFCHGCL